MLTTTHIISDYVILAHFHPRRQGLHLAQRRSSRCRPAMIQLQEARRHTHLESWLELIPRRF